jgi:hypothetical protein
MKNCVADVNFNFTSNGLWKLTMKLTSDFKLLAMVEFQIELLNITSRDTPEGFSDIQ